MKKFTDVILDEGGNIVAGAELYVRKQSDNSLLTLYSDDGVTETANPAVSASDGYVTFYTANNVLKLEVHVDGELEKTIDQYQHFDFSELTDPNADRIAFWDDSASDMAWLGLDTGLSISGTTLSLGLGTSVQAYDADLAAIAALADPNADRILFWDDSAGAYAYLAPSTGLAISTTNLAVDAATTAQILSNTADKVLLTDDTWAAAAPVALTDAATVAVDFSAGINFTLTIGGNRTLGNPTNVKDQTGYIAITQDGTGSRTLAFGTSWEFAGGTAPILSTAAGAKDILFYQVLGATSIYASLVKAVA
jgi:hypothetical protein